MTNATPLSPAAQDFLLRRDITFLNHGSFGACPQPVFAAYHDWEGRVEAQPVSFLGREIDGLLAEARAPLAAYLGAERDNIVFVPNATAGVNIVARSLELGPGDEVVATDHEYGASDRTWRFLSLERGFRYINQPVPLPIRDPAEVVERLWAGVTPRTKVIFLSHITSPTGILFPIAEVIQRARAAGMLTVIDGAHGPGQVPLALDALGADFYTGNCHKWLCTPKGSAFLYARPERQGLLRPLIVSWGYEARQPSGSTFQDLFGWTGTADPAAYLSVPAGIAFQREHHWDEVRAAAHTLAVAARERVNDLFGAAPICPPEMLGQMAAMLLPAEVDAEALKARLWDEYQIEIPVSQWHDRWLLRVSIQGYNSPADVDRLVGALREIYGD